MLLVILPQRLQTHNIEYATPHIALLLLCDRRRTLSSGLLAREGWHGREEELLRALEVWAIGRVGYRSVGLIRAGCANSWGAQQGLKCARDVVQQ